jgi:hypothetical protein
VPRRARDWFRAEWAGKTFMAAGMKDPVLGPPVMRAVAPAASGGRSGCAGVAADVVSISLPGNVLWHGLIEANPGRRFATCDQPNTKGAAGDVRQR